MLTKIDIAAMRKADRIVFRSESLEERRPYTIEAIKEAPEATPSNPFPQEGRHIVEVSASVRDYSEGAWGGSHGVESYSAFEMVYSAQYDDEWKTVVGLLKEGDKLTLIWTHHNSTPALLEVGVCVDNLTLRIDRGDKRLSFNIETRATTGTRHGMVKVRKKVKEAA
jgi:hypothetical protein